MPKPALGPVNVGDHLLVIPAPDHRTKPDPIDAVVTKKGRAWIELDRTDAEQYTNRSAPYRLRLDTQRDVTGYGHGYSHRFVTAEQYAYEQRIHEAWQALTDAGINPTSGSLWRTDEDRFLALGDFIRQYDADTPA